MDRMQINFGLKVIVDSLYRKKLIAPLLVVAVHAGKREEWYGVAGKPDFKNRGKRADKYAAFIDNELYPYLGLAQQLGQANIFKTLVSFL